MSIHERFILTPITSVLEEMTVASSGIGKGIETYSLWDYVLQSTFTKMTGFQEQKIKCIDWELATNGFEYRNKFVDQVQKRGTYSTYKAKNEVFNVLINEIIRFVDVDRDIFLAEFKNKININPRKSIQNILANSNIINCKMRDFNEFLGCDKEFNVNQFIVIPTKKSDNPKLFEAQLMGRYEELYSQRNRVAHNTLSYQQNLPDLEKLKKENGLSRNYFFWFAILHFIDEIFMELYKEYSQCLLNNSFFVD